MEDAADPVAVAALEVKSLSRELAEPPVELVVPDAELLDAPVVMLVAAVMALTGYVVDGLYVVEEKPQSRLNSPTSDNGLACWTR